MKVKIYLLTVFAYATMLTTGCTRKADTGSASAGPKLSNAVFENGVLTVSGYGAPGYFALMYTSEIHWGAMSCEEKRFEILFEVTDKGVITSMGLNRITPNLNPSVAISPILHVVEGSTKIRVGTTTNELGKEQDVWVGLLSHDELRKFAQPVNAGDS